MQTIVAALVAGCLPALAFAQGVLPGEVFTSLIARPLAETHPVLGADGRVHLAFEVLVSNPSRLFMTLDKVEAMDPTGASLWSLEGDGLAAMTDAWAITDGALPPGGTAVVLLDVPFAPDAAMPDRVDTRITATRRLAGADGKPAAFPAGEPVPATVTFTAAETPVGAPAVALDPPLRGDGWVALNGCCDAPTSHRTGLQAIDGALKAPERFAIDWVELDASGRIFTGDGTSLAGR